MAAMSASHFPTIPLPVSPENAGAEKSAAAAMGPVLPPEVGLVVVTVVLLLPMSTCAAEKK